MPFCRECGKEVQADWVTCPYCSQPIGPPASQLMSVQDSVVAGDVNITQNLASKQTMCEECGTYNVKLFTCVNCPTIFCEECTKRERRYLGVKMHWRLPGMQRKFSFPEFCSRNTFQSSGGSTTGPYCSDCLIQELEISAKKFDIQRDNWEV